MGTALVLGLAPKKKDKAEDDEDKDLFGSDGDDDEVSDSLTASIKELKAALKAGDDEAAALAFKNCVYECKGD